MPDAPPPDRDPPPEAPARRSTRLSDEDFARLLRFRTELRRFVRWSETEAHGLGMTPALHQLLLAVRGQTDAQPPTIGDVAQVLLVRHHSAVELVQRAVDLGLLARTRDTEDHRQVHLRLTDRGAERLEELSRRHLPEIRRLAEVLEQAADHPAPE